ncbi:DNA alkylation repair protein, partial [bacterium]|nr:DNA alkylation repair protein [bacterium]
MEAFKNIFNRDFVNSLAIEIQEVYPSFLDQDFVSAVFDFEYEKKELKQRMRHISQTLFQFLPQDYEKSIYFLMLIAPKFDGLATMVLPDFVEVYGLDHLEVSIGALEVFTSYGSSEFGVRPFLIKYPKEMVLQMYRWSKSENEHIRRLASEGIRPRLPWAMSLPFLKEDPQDILPILERLKDD